MFKLTYLSLSTYINTCEFERAYENSLWHIHKLFSAYLHNLSEIAYENNYTTLSFATKIAYT